MSRECDISRGLCCQLQRRHRQTPRKVIEYILFKLENIYIYRIKKKFYSKVSRSFQQLFELLFFKNIFSIFT